MPQVIYKFPIQGQETVIEQHKDSKILCVQTQAGEPVIWVLNDTDKEKELVTFEVVPTGKIIEEKEREYIGTFQLAHGALVYHLFKLL